MAVRLTRTEQAAATEWRLLEAAHRVFLRFGFHGATLDEVAREAGFTKGAVYSRFGSKADLFLALLERRAAQRASDVRTRAATTPPEDVPAAAGRHWAHALRDDLGWMLLVIEFRVHAARIPELNRRYAAVHALVHQATAEVLGANVEALGLRLAVPVEDAARGLLALFSGFVLECAVAPDQMTDALGAILSDALGRGLLEPVAAAPARRSRS